MKTFELTIARVDGPVFDGPAVSVSVPGSEGEMTILANHEPLISALKSGVVTVTKEDNSEETFEVASGTLEVSNNAVSILL